MTKTSGKRVGVVLSGCGYLDGSEVHEATLTLLALDRKGAQVTALAPFVDQLDVVDHQTERPSAGDRRSVPVEAARISRGAVKDLAKVSSDDFDALIFPGGFGAAKNLSSFAAEGKAMKVNPDVARLVTQMRAAGKPMGFICIAPVIAARVLGSEHPRLTIGNDPETIATMEALGARHQVCEVDEIAVDQKIKVVSTPAYMLGPTIAKVAAGIDKLVSAVLEMA